MTNLAEKRHYDMAVTSERATPASPGANPLSDLETLPLSAGVTDGGGLTALIEQVEHWAGELLDPAFRDEERLRLLARMIAALRASLALRETQREQALKGGDVILAVLVDRMVQTDTRRLSALLRAHRSECERGARPVNVTVATGDHAQVNILAGDAR